MSEFSIPARILSLKQQLRQLDDEMLKLEVQSNVDNIQAEHRDGARNLLHYVALRRQDIRELQQELANLGLSSLGRSESHVRASVGAVLRILTHLDSCDPPIVSAPPEDPAAGAGNPVEGRRILAHNTKKLFGCAPGGRTVRIMVTMPSEAATDYALVRDLLTHGMNCMRINCAHDGPAQWSSMIQHLRRAEQETGFSAAIEMDVAGPKLRTGPIEPGPAVAKIRPVRNEFGRVVAPARVWLTPNAHPESPPAPSSCALRLPLAWLARLKPGSRIQFTDTRGAGRILIVRERREQSLWAECNRTAYVTSGTTLRLILSKPTLARTAGARVGPLPHKEQTLLLRKGDSLILTRDLAPGRPAEFDEVGNVLTPARIGVTLPEVFDSVQPGEPVWFDDGKIGGVIANVTPHEIEVRIDYARPGGDRLGAEKGINLPGTNLRMPSLTSTDIETLQFIAAHATIVGFSFVRNAGDVREIRERLAALGRPDLGIVLKIETRQGFENLPPILLEAMRSPAVGVMIARGDLAIECGFERLAEIQEEILWIAESAHVPVIWATQVLETLAKTGRPSRSEITDAAMGERAECVMLNKGKYVVEAVHILNDILRRMEAHQEKKSSRLRQLRVATDFQPLPQPPLNDLASPAGP